MLSKSDKEKLLNIIDEYIEVNYYDTDIRKLRDKVLNMNIHPCFCLSKEERKYLMEINEVFKETGIFKNNMPTREEQKTAIELIKLSVELRKLKERAYSMAKSLNEKDFYDYLNDYNMELIKIVKKGEGINI